MLSWPSSPGGLASPSLTLASPSLMLTKIRMRSVDQKLRVSKIPIREPEHPFRALSADRRKKLERIRTGENERNRLDRIGKIILRKLSLKLGT